jgi:hypothetical protein
VTVLRYVWRGKLRSSPVERALKSLAAARGAAAILLATLGLTVCRGPDRDLARQAASDSVAAEDRHQQRAGASGKDTAAQAGDPVSPATPDPGAGQTEEAGTERVSEWTTGIAFRARIASGIATATTMRSAAGPDYDRLVIEFEGGLPGHHVEYVDRPVRSCASGAAIALPGDAWLSIRMQPAAGHNDAGRVVALPNAAGRGARNFLKVAVACDFEADYTLVLAVRSPRSFRVLELANPYRLVVDVRWP